MSAGDRIAALLADSARIYAEAWDRYCPAYVASMVSGGKDSACSHAVALEVGAAVNIIIHSVYLFFVEKEEQ